MKLTFSPNLKNKGERTGLVVMGRDYAGLILEIQIKVLCCRKLNA